MQCDHFHVHVLAQPGDVAELLSHDAHEGQHVHRTTLEAKEGTEEQKLRNDGLATGCRGKVGQILFTQKHILRLR